MNLSSLSPGSLFAGRFEILECVGVGGMGMVYRTRDHHSGNQVALKLLTATSSPSASSRFLREGRLLAELQHPGIVGYVAHGQDANGPLFLAMEWLHGEDLSKRLSRGPLLISEVLSLGKGIAAALSISHARSILHRDLKPSNIFLRNGDVSSPVLLDFGIARRLMTSLAVTGTGGILGTPQYMSPEQARGEPDLTPATDVFSLGCLIYECLAGVPPFQGEHIAAVLMKILLEAPPHIATFRSGVPVEFSDLLMQMLSKEPLARPADARAVGEALGKIQLSETEATGPTLDVHPAQTRFAHDEQVLVSMVVACPSSSGPVQTPELSETGNQESEHPQHTLIEEIRAMGAGVERLLNRTLVVSICGTESASDQALKAARIALLIKQRWSSATVVLTTGRALHRGVTPIGEVADRAASMMREIFSADASAMIEQSAQSMTQSGVWLDRTSAGLLERQFVITADQGHALLTGEELDADKTRPLLGKPTTCIGREGELAALETMLSTCIENEEAAVVLVIAPPGAGKSRLRHELLRRLKAREQAGTALLGYASAIGTGQPYSLLSDMFRRLCGLRGGETLSVQRQRLLERVGQNISADKVQHVAEFLGEMCGILFPAEESESLLMARGDPRSMASLIAEALSAFLRAESEHGPVLLILEDLHWSDALTIRCMEQVVTALHDVPLMILAFARPEVFEQFPKLWKKLTIHEVKLSKLSRKAAERLVVQVLGRSLPADVVAHIVEQADGNALLLEELIRATAELGTNATTGTVLAILQARLGRVEASARRALRIASVLGTTFWAEAIEKLMGGPLQCPSGQVEGWLQTLQNEELIEKQLATRFPGQAEYRFRHALIREAAYELLTEEDRCRGHEVAAQYLIERDPACLAVDGLQSQITVGILLRDPDGRRALEKHGALFDIVHHLNLSISSDALNTPHFDEAEANLLAAQKAEDAAAIETALRYADAGRRLLGPTPWAASFELFFQLTTKRGEYEFVSGAPEQAEKTFSEVEARCVTLEQLIQYCTWRYVLVEVLAIPFDRSVEELLARIPESERNAEA